MGFRNPFRIQVDENDVAYLTDYSPDSSVPGPFRGPAGTGRMEIVRKPGNYGWPLCYRTDLPYYKWDFNTSTTLGETYECGNASRGPENTSRWNTGRTVTPPITNPDLWYSFQDATWGTPCLASYNPRPATPCPWLWPELGDGGVGPHGATKYHYDAANPSTTKLPPYYDGAVLFGEFTRDYLKEIRLDSAGKVQKINNLFDCGAVGSVAQPFECDNPMDLQIGADGNFYLLTYGDGFFAANADAGMYRFAYVKGQRAPQAVLGATPTDGRAPLTVAFSSEGSRDPDPADSIRFAWDFTNDGTVDSIDPDPSFTYTANGVYTARLTVTDSSGKTDSKTTVITVGNTSPTVVDRHAARRRLLRVRPGHPVLRDGHRSRGRADRLLARGGHVRARARHARPRRGQRERLLRRAAHGRGGRQPRRSARRRHQRHLHGHAAPTASPR